MEANVKHLFTTVSSSALPFYPVGTGECIRLCKEKMDSKNIYLTNPAFDKKIQPRTGVQN